jgi:Tfp pilus assembly protein PilN
MAGVWLTRIEFAEDGGEVSLAGRATRADLVSAYLEGLRREEALRGQTFSRLEVKRPAKAPYVEFVLAAGEPAEGK